jgi:hypothetical protein
MNYRLLCHISKTFFVTGLAFDLKMATTGMYEGRDPIRPRDGCETTRLGKNKLGSRHVREEISFFEAKNWPLRVLDRSMDCAIS